MFKKSVLPLGYSIDFSYNESWDQQGLVCGYEHCIENMPMRVPRKSDKSCPLFGHDCPSGKLQIDWCLGNNPTVKEHVARNVHYRESDENLAMEEEVLGGRLWFAWQRDGGSYKLSELDQALRELEDELVNQEVMFEGGNHNPLLIECKLKWFREEFTKQILAEAGFSLDDLHNNRRRSND